MDVLGYVDAILNKAELTVVVFMDTVDATHAKHCSL